MSITNTFKTILISTAILGSSHVYAQTPEIDIELLKQRTLCELDFTAKAFDNADNALYQQIKNLPNDPLPISGHAVALDQPLDFQGLQATHIIFANGGGVGVVFSGTKASQLVQQYELSPNPHSYGGYRKFQREVNTGPGMFEGWEVYTMLYVDEPFNKTHTMLYCLMDTRQVR